MEREGGKLLARNIHDTTTKCSGKLYALKKIDPIMVKTSNIDTIIIYYVFSLVEHIEQHSYKGNGNISWLTNYDLLSSCISTSTSVSKALILAK